MKEYTHKELVARAVSYLTNTLHCGVAMAGAGMVTQEIPDAIGWKYAGNYCAVIECKVSRADFLRDRKKECRTSMLGGLGSNRFYMAPKGMIRVDELPEHWGLIEVTGNRAAMVKGHKYCQTPVERNRPEELAQLYAAARRNVSGCVCGESEATEVQP